MPQRSLNSNCTSLSFVDLPGIVSNKDPRTIELVKELVLKHIRGNCLILVALTIGGV